MDPLLMISILLSQQVQGTLIAVDGSPVTMCTVVSRTYNAGKAAEHSTQVDGAGHFNLSAVPFSEKPGKGNVLYFRGPGNVPMVALQQPDGNTFKVIPEAITAFQVQGEDGSPVADAKVTFKYGLVGADIPGAFVGFPASMASAMATRTDSQGTCSLTMPKCRYGQVDIVKPGFATETVALPVFATPIVKLSPACTVKGTVLSENGKPMAGITVLASGDHSTIESDSDSNGQYTITGLKPGVYGVAVGRGGPAGYVTKAREGVYLKSGQEIDGLDLHFEEGLWLKGRVVDAEEGKPLAGVSVNLVKNAAGNYQTAVTDKSGSFRFCVPSGEVTVLVNQTPAGQVQSGDYMCSESVSEKEAVPVTIRIPKDLMLPPQKGANGVVVDSADKPVAGARVDFINFHGASGVTSVTTDSQGKFSYDEIIARGTSVRAQKGDSATAAAIEVLGANPLKLKLIEHALATVHGKCTTDDGSSPAGKPVNLTLWNGNSGQAVANTVTDANGEFEFKDLVPGSYGAGIQTEGYANSWSHTFQVTAGATKECSLTLKAANSKISGTVLDSNGKPMSGAVVCEQGQGSQTVTDANGKFTLSHVPKDLNIVTVMSGGSMMGFQLAADHVIHMPDMNPQNVGRYVPFQQYIGLKAPEIQGARWINSKPLTLASLKGKIVVLDFWAIWCGPCKEALPQVMKLAAAYPDDVQVIGIHVTGTEDAKIDAFVKERGLTYPLMVDRKSKHFGSSVDSYPVNGIPTVIVINREGKIVYAANEIEGAVDLISKMMSGKK
jgi:thiol-disulfide isomerase/thioredoxin/protocatechuate 3,4-dioxygenase beta subunit